MSTYLQLTNFAILESGADLDEMTSGEFTAPTDSMQKKFKAWTAQAWREIQMEINNWEFKSKQAQLIIRPRLLVVDGDRATAPPVASEYEGDDTSATFTVVEVNLLGGTWAAGTAEAIIEYSDLDGEFKWNELYDEVEPDDSLTDVFRLKWWGRYDLQTEVSDLLEPITTSFFIQSTGGSATQDNIADTDNGPLVYVPWGLWLAQYEGDPVNRGRPQFFTTTPDGQYDFWPRLDEEYVLTFTYSAEPQELSAAADEPDFPTQYHDMIAWRAVMYWADYQERPNQFTRAERRYETIKNRLEGNQKPKFSLPPNAFNYAGWGF
jgi:hypothetical protein